MYNLGIDYLVSKIAAIILDVGLKINLKIQVPTFFRDEVVNHSQLLRFEGFLKFNSVITSGVGRFFSSRAYNNLSRQEIKNILDSGRNHQAKNFVSLVSKTPQWVFLSAC